MMDLKNLYFIHDERGTSRVTGRKCRAVKDIRSYQGMIRAFTEGTIEYEMENLGRSLIHVRWSNGMVLNVFPNEIEIIEES